MKRLTKEISHFFKKQSFTIVTTVGKGGIPHNSCKGIVEISKGGKVYLLDLYKQKTYGNLRRNPRMSVTAVDEHRFRGYCLKGKAKLITKEKLDPQVISAWEDKMTDRITRRVIKNIHEEKGHPRHPEALFPGPAYMIVMQIEEVVDLTPHHLRPEV